MIRGLLVTLVGVFLLSGCGVFFSVGAGADGGSGTDGGSGAGGGAGTDAGVSPSLRPNLMILLDKSGSMVETIPPSGQTRMQALQAAMKTFLEAPDAVARMGLTLFPADGVCGASTSVAVALPPATASDDAPAKAAQLAKAAEILSRINSTTPGGGTPTNLSLQFLGTQQDLQQNDGRPDFVLLLTDGLPNCNASNTATCANPAQCRCTQGSAANSCGAPGSAVCTLGCLDQNGSVDAVLQLKAKNIKTIVVGFGADTSSGDAPQVLNALAEAGGFPRACPNATDAECGGSAGSCISTTRVCNTKFYQATNGNELAAVLNQIGQQIAPTP